MNGRISRCAGAAAIDYCDERVEKLAQFQEAALRHALSFPSLQRLVYSTCRCSAIPWCNAAARFGHRACCMDPAAVGGYAALLPWLLAGIIAALQWPAPLLDLCSA